MTEAKCLPGCRGSIWPDGRPWEYAHANGCPNAKAAEPVKAECKCGGNLIPNVMHTPDGCYSVPDRFVKPAPPQDAEPVDEEWATADGKMWVPKTAYLALRSRLEAIEAQAEDATEYVLAVENRELRAKLAAAEKRVKSEVATIKLTLDYMRGDPRPKHRDVIAGLEAILERRTKEATDGDR